MYQRTDTQSRLMLEKAIFLEDVYANMASRERKFKKTFHKPSLFNKYLDLSIIGEILLKSRLFFILCFFIS